MVLEIVARDAEIASVREFIERTEEGPRALVLEGEAGVGKSTLWLAAVEHARAFRVSVLSARPAEAERRLAHTGLGDLFDDVLDDVAPALSQPRRRALETALLREERRRRVRRSSRARRGGTRRAPPARAALPRPRCHRRRSVARRVHVERARLRAATARGGLGSAAARAPAGTNGVGAHARRRRRRADPGGPAERRCATPAPARSPRQGVCPPDVAPHPRAVGRESVLRAGVGPHARGGRQSARSITGPRDARRALARTARRASRQHARRARSRVRARYAAGIAARSSGGGSRRARAGGQRARDRARGRDDPLHAPAAVVGALQRSWSRGAGRCTDVLRRSRTTA